MYKHPTTTKMKGLPRYLSGLACFFLGGIQVMIVNVVSTEAQGLTAGQLLAQKQGELDGFVLAIEANSRNCSALMGCSSSIDGCSRLSCYQYGTPDDSDYKCLGVANNTELCGAQCKERNWDFSKGFVRLVDSASHIARRTVCTHRTLDDHFKSSSLNDSTHFFRVFFGAVDGTTRIYPGADEHCNNDYDPRSRPWYLDSIQVHKVVSVLIDSGSTMLTQKITGGDNTSETYFNTAVNTAFKFLKTLEEGSDFVNITCFDRDGMIPTLNAGHDMKYTSQLYQSLNDSLTQIVKNGIIKNDPTAANISSAINITISDLTRQPSPIPENYLKVVIVLTFGTRYENIAELNISANSGVNVFVYNFFRFKNRTAHCANSTSIRAYSDEIPSERFDNPLYALHSYYSFLAKVHNSFMRNRTDYGTKLQDYSNVDNNALALSRAAFGPYGEFLGVVGILFFEDKVNKDFKSNGILFQDIVLAATNSSEQQEVTFDASKDLITSVCFNPTDACPAIDTNPSEFLCQPSNNDSRIGCCGGCKPKYVKKPEWGKILGGVAVGIAVLLVIAAMVYFIWKACIAWRQKGEKVLVENPHFIFPGPGDGAVLQGTSDKDRDSNFGLKAPGPR